MPSRPTTPILTTSSSRGHHHHPGQSFAAPPSPRTAACASGTARSSIHASSSYERGSSPGPMSPIQNQQRPTFVHSTTLHATTSTAQMGSSNAWTRSGGSGYPGAKNTLYDEISSKESYQYYPPEFQASGSTAYPFHYQQYIPFTRPEHSAPPRRASLTEKLRLGSWGGISALRCGGQANDGGGLGRAMMWGWVITTVGFFGAIAFWRGQLFHALDDMSHYLSEQGLYGHMIFFALILMTTIPPLPLYSTLIILSGYTFGVWEGFIISYLASLVGAVVVFVISRRMLKDVIVKSLAGSAISMSLLNIIQTHPHILLLIRIAPYPYNLLNVILASSPTLTLQTYTGCTAVSLCKLVLHTWIGSGLYSLSESYSNKSSNKDGSYPDDSVDGQWPNHQSSDESPTKSDQGDDREHVKTLSTWIGIVLCIGLFFYLTHMAKSAVRKAQTEQAELEEREREERVGLTDVRSDGNVG